MEIGATALAFCLSIGFIPKPVPTFGSDALARGLQLLVLAEGVETRDELALIGRLLPIERYADFIGREEAPQIPDARAIAGG